MFKRTVIVFSVIMLCFCAGIVLLNNITTKESLYDAAVYQRSYKLKVADVRGTVYDCRGIPLINRTKKLIAAIVPGTRVFNELSSAISSDRVSELWKKLSLSEPFTVEVDRAIDCPEVKTFEVPIRYSGVVPATHIIGYLSGDNVGISGIEKAYDDYLKGDRSEICIRYSVDASNRLLSGGSGFVEDRSYFVTKGIMLNIDCRIQKLVEEVSNKYLSKGAVVITEVPNCEIRAIVSLPGFDPQGVSKYLNDENSPMINRAFSQYSFGSIFKLVTAATALENGIDESFQYDCKGFNEVNGNKFKCFGGKPHGVEDLGKAIAYSCNGYFIEIAKKAGADELLNMSKKFGFGEPIEFAPGMSCSKGVLPLRESLNNFGVLANFSFGQGKLMAVPVQVSGMINAIASKGIYTVPKLVSGLVDENMEITCNKDCKQPSRIISEITASKLKKYMTESIEYGTSSRGKPEKINAAAKTSTAQSGIINSDGQEIIQAWYAGFFPVDDPKYSVVVLSEGGVGGGESCGPVFKEIIDKMYTDLKELFVD